LLDNFHATGDRGFPNAGDAAVGFERDEQIVAMEALWVSSLVIFSVFAAAAA
jgi:hypothetical protein